jgi:hypothetical protein
MLLVGLVTFEHKSEKSQVVSILCTWHLMTNQRKRAQWGRGGGQGGGPLLQSQASGAEGGETYVTGNGQLTTG